METAPLRNPQFPLWLASIANLGVAFLQLLLLLPGIVEGRAFGTPFPLAYHVDSLSLTFGVVWSFAMGLTLATLATMGPDWSQLRGGSNRVAWSICLMSLGLLGVAYSRDMLVLYVGWEVAGLALWLAFRQMWVGRKVWLLLALHSPGWVLLAVVAFGLTVPLTPPAGGIAQPWPLPVAIAFEVVVLVRSGCWPFHAWSRIATEASGGAGAVLLGLYCLAAPYLLAKMLVAAPWDAAGIWALTLLGTLGLLGNIVTGFIVEGTARISAIASAHASVALIGFGLSSGSPLAAMGAVALLLSGTLWVAVMAPMQGVAFSWARVLGGWGTLLGGAVGVWAIAQGALSLHYGLVAAVLLPAGAVLVLDERRRTMDDGNSIVHRPSSFVFRLLPLALLACVSLYPQALVEWVLRPAVGAMAGGVGVLRSISSEWGVGLLARSGDETILAALPATGIALAVALALITLYWLTRLVRRFVPEIRSQKSEVGNQNRISDF